MHGCQGLHRQGIPLDTADEHEPRKVKKKAARKRGISPQRGRASKRIERVEETTNLPVQLEDKTTIPSQLGATVFLPGGAEPAVVSAETLSQALHIAAETYVPPSVKDIAEAVGEEVTESQEAFESQEVADVQKVEDFIDKETGKQAIF
jgi:hypothetical protein